MLFAILFHKEDQSLKDLKQTLENYFKDVEIIAVIHDESSLIEKLRNSHFDLLLLLDVKFEKGLGLLLLESICLNVPEVFFVSIWDRNRIKSITYANKEYIQTALGFNSLSTFKKSTFGMRSIISSLENIKEAKRKTNMVARGAGKLMIKNTNGNQFLDIETIAYLSADRNYTNIYFSNKQRLLVSQTLGHFEAALVSNNFFRVHKSYVVNLFHVSGYTSKRGGELMLSNNEIVPVSKRRKESLFKKLKTMT